MAILKEMIHSLLYSKPCCCFFLICILVFVTTLSYGCFPLFCLGLFVRIGLLANVMHHFCRTERAAHDQAVCPWREESAQPETALSLSELMCSICGLTKLGNQVLTDGKSHCVDKCLILKYSSVLNASIFHIKLKLKCYLWEHSLWHH